MKITKRQLSTLIESVIKEMREEFSKDDVVLVKDVGRGIGHTVRVTGMSGTEKSKILKGVDYYNKEVEFPLNYPRYEIEILSLGKDGPKKAEPLRPERRLPFSKPQKFSDKLDSRGVPVDYGRPGTFSDQRIEDQITARRRSKYIADKEQDAWEDTLVGGLENIWKYQ